jgi:hypothetical protein
MSSPGEILQCRKKDRLVSSLLDLKLEAVASKKEIPEEEVLIS